MMAQGILLPLKKVEDKTEFPMFSLYSLRPKI
jgi:hypothetical protein